MISLQLLLHSKVTSGRYNDGIPCDEYGLLAIRQSHVDSQ